MGLSGHDIYVQMVQHARGTGAIDTAIVTMGSMQIGIGRHITRAQQLMDRLVDSYQGNSGDAAVQAIAPLKASLQDTSDAIKEHQKAFACQGEGFKEVQPKIQPVSATKPSNTFNNVMNHIFTVGIDHSDLDTQRENWQNTDNINKQHYQTYTGMTGTNKGYYPPAYQQQAAGISSHVTLASQHGSGVDYRHGLALDTHRGGSVGGTTSQHYTPHSQPSPPPNLPVGSAVAHLGTAASAVPPGAPSNFGPSGTVPSAAASLGPDGYQPGMPHHSAPGGFGPSGGAAGGGFGPVGSFGGPSGGGFGSRSAGAGFGAAGGSASGVGGRAGPGASPGGTTGAGEQAGAAAGARGGAAGGTPGGRGPAGRSGMGGMGRGGGKGGEDAEHSTASYLVNEDNGNAIVGHIEATAPPVIG